MFVSALCIHAEVGYPRCVPYVRRFVATEHCLTVTITKENDNPVTPHTELLSNPLSGKEAEALTKRGLVQFKAHVEKDSARLFVHWDTLRTDN
jgi:hypothetical protein